jgi:lysozyme
LQHDTLIIAAEALKADEGWVPHVYQDHLGFDTLGFGFLVDRRKGGRIPLPVAEFWLTFEIRERWMALDKAHPWFRDLPTGVQAALVNMAYQLGVAGVLAFRKMWACLARFDYRGAAAEALDSRWAQQTPARARRVAAAIALGE